MPDTKLNTDTAYALETPEQRKALYAAWAATYDDSFAAAVDYIFPQQVAQVFRSRGGAGPVLDAGAGTGLVAQAIAQHVDVVCDAFDLSAEMLAVAREKALYRNLIEGDLTKPLPFETGTFASVVSAGTFTHGHVGPDALDELLRIASADALFVLSIKAELFKDLGFDAKLKSFGAQIKAFEVKEVPIYGTQTDERHAGDMGLIVSFRCV